MQTLTEQMAEALETCLGELTNIDASFKERWEASKVGIVALDRYRNDPEAGQARREKGETVKWGHSSRRPGFSLASG